jgi:peptidoglycan hydrolase-like protein with peptidoglycan-binding domain
MKGVAAQRRPRLGLPAAAILVAALALTACTTGSRPDNGASSNGSATSLATVQRQSLSTQTQLNGVLEYAGSYPVLARSPGTVTWLPALGRVIPNGQVLFRINQAPVVLLYGATPAYRTLADGGTAADRTGRDVAQLNHDLVALGYLRSADVDSAWDVFSWATKAAVQRLQKHLGVTQTGELALGDVVFLPTAARITTLQASLGAPTNGPVLQATSTARTVSVALDTGLQSAVRAGDRVTIVLPDGRTTPGTVSSVGQVATTPSNDSGGSGGPGGAPSGPTVPVHIRPTDPTATGSLDRVLVQVTVTDQTVRNVLAVPVDALLARSGGGYAVEVVDSDGTHHLVPISVGLFDDAAGLVQASGAGLAAGLRVVVPANE